jgi:hypothetical protein
MKSNKCSLRDLSYTLANKREHRPYRAYALAESASCMVASVTQAVEETSPRVAWVFTGQGAQWPAMGAELLETNATFRSTIRKLDKVLLTLPEPVYWTIEGKCQEFVILTFFLKMDKDNQVDWPVGFQACCASDSSTPSFFGERGVEM